MIHFNKIIKGMKVRARQDDADAACHLMGG